ncbi:hypothetical protein SLEP1_g9816 [Rubroshorea leprosula]|uniref:Cyclin C-terminal domain-containing protein n=1 Tax=Rubroshorea leprosula TaxID=152421 RepID=A0AAV5IG00_9ROSI|nr:hypothetical protein SLEP1_g9816 [Rubroshorea leprosula]
MEYDLENPLTNFRSDYFPSLFLLESDHMPVENYSHNLRARDFDISVRREAISSISQFSYSIDPFLSYLAVNYLDRFLSSQGTPEPKTWAVRLLAISCVSLAAKMKKTEFSITDFPGDGGFIFDTQTVERMEYLILGALKWRMRSITPFSFVPFFISFFKLKDPPLMLALKDRATELIFKGQTDITLLEFKPSIVAASALLYACHELFPLQFPCLRKEISNCPYVNKENMSQCYKAMENLVKDGYESVFEPVSGSYTPVNVLDLDFSSSESNKTNASTIITATTIASHNLEGDMKRRKINDYHNNNQAVQFSQT